MTGTLIILVLIALLAAVLEFTERRTARRWHPGRDPRDDRDAARIDEELRAVQQAGPTPGADPEPIHLAPPADPVTDARLITRAAA